VKCLMIDDGGVRTGLVALPPYPWYSSGELRRRGHRSVARDVRCTSPLSHVPKAVRRDNVSGKIPRMCGDRCLELESRKRAEYFPVTEKMRGLSKSHYSSTGADAMLLRAIPSTASPCDASNEEVSLPSLAGSPVSAI
jgi:hypothetical protein